MLSKTLTMTRNIPEIILTIIIKVTKCSVYFGLGSGYFRENLVSLLCFLGRFGIIFIATVHSLV